MAEQHKIPIEEVVKQLGRYPLDAFLFVQECLTAASEQVHGPMSGEEAAVAQWMASNNVSVEDLRDLDAAGTLPDDAAEALAAAGGPAKLNRHVTGQQLCQAVRDVAVQRWGLMARSVLRHWNITRTQDIGAIIFALVESDWLQKQPTDRLEDFDDVFSFDEAFEQGCRLT